MGIADSRGFGCVLVIIIVVCLCLGAYVISTAIAPEQPRSTQFAQTRCVGLLNIGSCNITQTTYRPAPQDGSSDALLALFAVLAMLFLAIAVTRSGE